MASSRLIVSAPGIALADALGAPPEGVELVRWDMDGPPPRPALDIAVAPYMAGKRNALTWLEGVPVGLVQSQAIGYDGIEEKLPRGLVFANASSVHETATAELALALILAAQRGIPDYVRDAARGEWNTSVRAGLADHSVLIVGFGGIGRAIESRLVPFETSVVRVARTRRNDERGVIHGFDEVPDLLPRADIVVLSLPLTHETHHLVGDGFLSAMRDGALLVNVGRGAAVDIDALVAHARTGRVRAALDVTEPEPLPADHALFALPNVLISPHVGGATSAMLPRMARLLRDQIERRLRGEPPLNVVYRS